MAQTEIIHEHDAQSGTNTGLIIGLIVALIVVFIFFYYGLPAMRGMGQPQINVPSKVDVNVHTGK